jgi:serine/threonine protein phosphatase 1
MPPRTIAIGDIHGCARALAALIEAVDPRPQDTIVALGDYVDRGADSKGVLEQLIELARRTTLVPLVGNHEEMLLAVRQDPNQLEPWLRFGGVATLDSYGSLSIGAIPDDHFAFLESCRLIHESDRHFFVHANYAPDVPLDQQNAETLVWLSMRDSVPTPHVSGKVALVGHTPQKDGEVLDLGHLKCLDTGCCYGGWLTALDVESGEIWQADATGAMRSK